MTRLCSAFALFVLILCAPVSSSACGYNFIGDCSTGIGLRINNTLDSFAIAACPVGTVFQGLDLGLIQSLSLARATGVTWESCQNNVTNMALYYRVFETGQPGGAWQSLDLPEDYFTLIGPYTTRYRSKNVDVNLTNGLVPGNSYILEVYFRAEIDTIGDDFVPETFLLQNNNNQNYHLTFEYGGPSAPPFTVVTTLHRNLYCHGDSTGLAGVTVYGNQTNLFYQWSGYNNNFPILFNVPAGVYSVTVSGIGGYTQSQTITLTEPAPIENQFINLVPLSCGSGAGQVTAQASGSFPPFAYAWSTGQAGPTTAIPTSGEWRLTVTDAHACTALFSVWVPGSPAIETFQQRAICAGETLTLGGQTFDAPGLYDVLVAGAGGCDTLIHLSLAVVDPLAAIGPLPLLVELNCAISSYALCVQSLPNATYLWIKDGIGISTGPCVNITEPGDYTLIVTISTFGQICSASATVTAFVAPEGPPELSFSVINASGPNAADGTIIASASGGEPPYFINWEEFGGSAGPAVVLDNILPGTYCFTVTDANGCTGVYCATVSFTSIAPELPSAGAFRLSPNPVLAGEWLQIILPESRDEQAPVLEIFSLTGQLILSAQAEKIASTTWRLRMPSDLPEGVFLLRSRAAMGFYGRFLLEK